MVSDSSQSCKYTIKIPLYHLYGDDSSSALLNSVTGAWSYQTKQRDGSPYGNGSASFILETSTGTLLWSAGGWNNYYGKTYSLIGNFPKDYDDDYVVVKFSGSRPDGDYYDNKFSLSVTYLVEE